MAQPKLGYAKNVSGIKGDYYAECQTLSKLNHFFWNTFKSNRDCFTNTSTMLPSLGWCKFDQANGGVSISLNFEMIEDRTDDYHDFILVGKGVDYHEMAHALHAVRWPTDTYKPRSGYSMKEVMQALNQLMDQRDELCWLNDFPGTEKFLRYIVMHPNIIKGLDEEVAKTDDEKEAKTEYANKSQASLFLLCWGRRFYLPKVYVQRLKDSFDATYEPTATASIQDIIDRFLLTTCFEEQEPLVYEFLDVLRKYQISMPQQSIEMDMETFKELVKNGGIQQGCAGDNCSKIKIKIKDAPPGMFQSGDDSSDPADASGSGDGEEEIDDKGGDDFEGQKESMKGDAQDAENDVKQNALQAGVQSSDEIGDPFTPGAFALALKKNIEDVLKRARVDMGSHYQRKLTRGGVDVQRARTAEKTDDDKIFRRFQPSKIKKLTLATGLVLDQSGSMSYHSEERGVSNIQAATDITWAISAASHNYDCKTSVMGFDVDGKLMKTWDGRMENWYLKASGGTDPGNSFDKMAQEFLPYLRQRLPCLCVCITDGFWYGDQGAMGIKKLNGMGVWTVEFLIDCNEDIENHGCKYTKRVKSILDCAPIIEEIINDIQTEQRKKLGG